MSTNYDFNFFKNLQSAGVNGSSGTQKVSGQEKVPSTRRYQFFTGFNSGANTGCGDYVQAYSAINSAQKLLLTLPDGIIKNQLTEAVDKVRQLIASGASEDEMQAAINDLKNIMEQATSIKPSMGL